MPPRPPRASCDLERGGGGLPCVEERPEPYGERAGARADIPFCARESVLDVVPRLVAMRDGAAEISL